MRFPVQVWDKNSIIAHGNVLGGPAIDFKGLR